MNSIMIALKIYMTRNQKNTDSLMHETKPENVYEYFDNDKEMFDFSNYSTKSKYYNNSNKLVIRKIKDETGGAVIEESVGLDPNMYSLLVGNNEHKNQKT